jgi:uncharacterized protein YdaU (DUF1376 family)
MKYYRRNPGDYLSATGHLTLVEHGAYTVLMDTYYATEAGLPVNKRQLYRVAGACSRTEQRAVDRVVAEFFEQVGDRYMQSRVENELQSCRDKVAKLSRNGSLGGQQKSLNSKHNSLNEHDSGLANAIANAKAIAEQKLKHIHQPSTITKPNGLEKHSAAALFPGVDLQVVRDFEALRNKRRAPITQTVADAMRAEALKANLPIGDVLRMCCAKGWQGFDADWLHKPPPGGNETAKQREAREFFENLGRSRNDGNGNHRTTIDSTGKRVD